MIKAFKITHKDRLEQPNPRCTYIVLKKAYWLSATVWAVCVNLHTFDVCFCHIIHIWLVYKYYPEVHFTKMPKLTMWKYIPCDELVNFFSVISLKIQLSTDNFLTKDNLLSQVNMLLRLAIITFPWQRLTEMYSEVLPEDTWYLT